MGAVVSTLNLNLDIVPSTEATSWAGSALEISLSSSLGLDLSLKNHTARMTGRPVKSSARFLDLH